MSNDQGEMMDNEQLIDLLRDALDFANYPGKLGDGSRFALARRIGLTLDALAAAPGEECTLCDGKGAIDAAGATCPHCDGKGAETSAAPVDAQTVPSDTDIDTAIWHLKGRPEDFDLARRLIRRVFAAAPEASSGAQEAAK